MYIALRQIYRHLVQQAIVQHELRSLRCDAPATGIAWPVGGVAALLSAAAFCGTLAQIHLG